MKRFHSTDFSECVRRHKTVSLVNEFHLLMWFKKKRLETQFKGDNVKSLKRQFVKNWSFISLRKFRKLQHLLCFFLFQ